MWETLFLAQAGLGGIGLALGYLIVVIWSFAFMLPWVVLLLFRGPDLFRLIYDLATGRTLLEETERQRRMEGRLFSSDDSELTAR